MTAPVARRGVLGWMAMGAAGAALAGCHRAGETLRVGSQKGGTKALVEASDALAGAGYRVEWAEFPAAQNLLEAIASDAVDVGMVGDGPFAFAYQSGQPIVAVAARRVENRPAGALAVVVRAASPAHGMADIAGQKLATTRGSIGHYLALRALAGAGMAPDAVHFVFLSPSDAAAALRSGAVAAWATWAPYTMLAQAEGARVIADGRDLLVSTGFDVANARAIDGKRAILTDFLRREVVAMRWGLAHPDAYAAVLARETGMPLAITAQVARKNAFAPVPLDAALIASQREVAQTYAHAGVLALSRPTEQAFRPLL
ncbi:MAG TPA: ABC transporter substrate-binding protein [Novosphingobium sp.]|nr:ABC transporter substrate-binding protein [Novosphingobium sp.]